MEKTIDIIVMRHEEKVPAPASSDFYPGCLQDVELPLTPHGIEQSRAFGRDVLAQGQYDVVHATSSHQKRAIKTLAYVLKGAGFDVTEQGIPHQSGITAVSNIGISLMGWDWRHSSLPDFHRAPNDYIYKLLTEYFFPRNDIQPEHPKGGMPPVMAQLAANLLHDVNAGIADIAQTLQQKAQYQKGLVLVVTHAGYLDALANVLIAGNVFPDSHHVPQGVTLHRYPGYYGTGEYIRGRLVKHPEGPYLGSFTVKDIEVPVSDVALTSLKKTLLECADGDLSRVSWPIELPQLPPLPDTSTRLAPVVPFSRYVSPV